MKIRYLAFFVGALFIGVFLLSRSGPSVAPDYERLASVEGKPEVVIDIPVGSSGSEIARILFDNGVVKSSEAYFRVAVGDKRSEKVAPGSHRLTVQISAKQALEQLLDADRIPNLVRISEGAWKSEVVTSLIAFGFKKSEVMSAISKAALPQGFRDSEGLLFPAQYSFTAQTTALQAVQAMVDRFTSERISADLLQGSEGLTPLQLLTIASIVQAEGRPQDFAQVSRVIRNRLKIGMPLQMDSTVHFALKKRGNIFLSNKATTFASPYNTYKNYGLPPGPIGSPGAAAMKAALNPAIGDWLYFVTVAPGDTRFTSSFEQFNTWKALYIKNRKAGAFE